MGVAEIAAAAAEAELVEEVVQILLVVGGSHSGILPIQGGHSLAIRTYPRSVPARNIGFLGRLLIGAKSQQLVHGNSM